MCHVMVEHLNYHCCGYLAAEDARPGVGRSPDPRGGYTLSTVPFSLFVGLFSAPAPFAAVSIFSLYAFVQIVE